MTLVRKQCQGECGRMKLMPEHHSMCDKCWRKMQRRRRKARLSEEFQRGYAAGRADALCERGERQ